MITKPEHPNVLSGLATKRAEIAGRIEHYQAELRQLVIDLDNVEATMRLFDPDLDTRSLRPKPVPVVHHAFRGEVSRTAMQVLKAAHGPVTSLDIALKLMEARGLSPDDKGLQRLMVGRVGSCLRQQRARGMVRSVMVAGQFMQWELAAR